MTRSVCVLLFILFAYSFAFGQQSPVRGTVEGTVTESTHLPIAGASLQLIDPSTNENRTVTTDGGGNFRITGLRVGTYALHANAPGFSTYTQTGIVLTLDQTIRLNIDLVPAQVKSQITVTAPPSPLDVAQTSVTSVIGHEQIEELPVRTRNALDFVLLAPGVSSVRARGAGGNLHSGPAGSPSAAFARAATTFRLMDSITTMNTQEPAGRNYRPKL